MDAPAAGTGSNGFMEMVKQYLPNLSQSAEGDVPWYTLWWVQLIIYVVILSITIILLIWVPGKASKTLLFFAGVALTILAAILLNLDYTGMQNQESVPGGKPSSSAFTEQDVQYNPPHHIQSGEHQNSGAPPNSALAAGLQPMEQEVSVANERQNLAVNAPFVGHGNNTGAGSRYMADMSVPENERPPGMNAAGKAMPEDHVLRQRQAVEANLLEPFVKKGPGNRQTPGYELQARPEEFSSASIDPDLIQDPIIGDGLVPQDFKYSKDNVSRSEIINDVTVPPNQKGSSGQASPPDSYLTYYNQAQEFQDAIKGAEEDFYGRNEVRRAQELQWGLQKQEDPMQNAARTANGFTQLQNLAAQHTPLRRDPSLLDPPGFVSEPK